MFIFETFKSSREHTLVSDGMHNVIHFTKNTRDSLRISKYAEASFSDKKLQSVRNFDSLEIYYRSYPIKFMRI